MAKQYSVKERKAFHMGRAWAAGKDGKRVFCRDEKTKQSFRNGVKATRNRQKGSSNKKRAQACGVPAFVVDGDGVILQVLNEGCRGKS